VGCSVNWSNTEYIFVNYTEMDAHQIASVTLEMYKSCQADSDTQREHLSLDPMERSDGFIFVRM